jgi:hypothetical protein
MFYQGSYQCLRKATALVEADSLFVTCPRCLAWPMAAHVADRGIRSDVRFMCPRCGHKLTAQLKRFRLATVVRYAEEAKTAVDR